MDQPTVDAIPNVVKMALDWLLSVAREMLAVSVFEIPDAFAADLPHGENLALPAAE